MNGVNLCILVGHCGKDPETKSFDSGTTKTSFSLATTKKVKEESITQWHNIVAWGKVAEIIDKYVKKGDPLYVQGEINYRTYDDKDGNKKYITEINVNQVQMLGGKKQQSDSEATHEEGDAEIFPKKSEVGQYGRMPEEPMDTKTADYTDPNDNGMPF